MCMYVHVHVYVQLNDSEDMLLQVLYLTTVNTMNGINPNAFKHTTYVL
jgi:hypothetical protein